MNGVLVTVAGLSLATQSLTVEAVMGRIRQAVLHERSTALKGDLVLTGDAMRMGLKGSYTLRIGRDGRFVSQVRSALGRKLGFNGQTLWEADRTGATRVLSFGEGDRERSLAMIFTGRWLDPRSGCTIQMPVPAPALDGYTLQVKAKGSEIEMSVLVDPATYLPRVVHFESSAGPATLELSEWSETPGARMPFSVIRREGGVSEELRVFEAKLEPEAASGPFEMPTWNPRDTRFDPQIPADVEARKLRSGHIIVRPRVNGRDIGWFILDSGAEAMCIDKGAADELGLMSIGKVPAVGIGGVVQTAFRPAREFALGPVSIQSLMFVELDLAQIGRLLGLRLGGIVGYDVFRRSIVEVDVRRPSVALFDPAKYSPKKSAWRPLRFDGGNIAVEAAFEGNRRGWFRLDTGASGSVSFHSPFVSEWKLLEGREVTTTVHGGVGGTSEARQGKIAYFELAGHRFEQPTVTFSLATVGAFNDRWLVGNIGQDFLAPFLLVFDYPQSRLGFVRQSVSQ